MNEHIIVGIDRSRGRDKTVLTTRQGDFLYQWIPAQSICETEHQRDALDHLFSKQEAQNAMLERLATSLYRARGELEAFREEKNAAQYQCNRSNGRQHALHLIALDLLELKDLADSCDARGIERPKEYHERKKIAWAALRGFMEENK